MSALTPVFKSFARRFASARVLVFLAKTSLARVAALALTLLAAPGLYAQTNLISNGDFSAPTTNGSVPTSWTKDFTSYGIYSGSATMTPHSGSYLLHAGDASTTGGVYQNIATTANRTYLATLWLQGWANIGAGGDSLNRQQGALVVGGTSGNSSVTLGSSLLQTTAATVNMTNATVTNFMAYAAGATGSSPWYQQASSFTATGSTTRIGVYNVSTASFKSAANVDDVGVYAANDWNTNSDGNWSTGSNWADSSAPNATGAVAAFSGVATAPRTITLDSNATVGALIFNNANAYTISGANSLTLSGNFVSGNASGSFMGPVITVNSGNHSINTSIAVSGALDPLFAINQGTQLTVGGGISGSTGLVKSGFGTLTLTGNNTYSGATAINAGTLEVAGSGRLGGGSYSANISNSGTFLYNGTNSQTLSGVISGIGALTKNGIGTLTLSGNNTYTGITTINAGTLEIGSAGRLGGGSYAGAITNNGALINSGTNAQTLSGAITGTGALTQNASSTLTLSGANNYNGTTTINAGTLAIGNNMTIGAITGAGNLTLSSGTLTTISSSNTTLSGAISGGGALTKNGSGTLTLAGATTHSGATAVSGGTLQLTGNISSSALTLNSGGVISVGTNSYPTTVNKVNASSLTLSGGSGYAFTIGNISGGTVGTAGTDYDQLTTTGAITFNNTAANPFTVYLNGTPTNWSSSGSYTWNILSGASLSGFSSGNFIADTSAFGASLASGASFTFGTSGGNLTLTYGTAGTPVWAGGTGVWSGNFTPSLSNNLPILFTGAGGTATNDIGNATLSAVGAITFNSTAGAYTLAANSGSAGFNATTVLAVNGDITNDSANLQTINTAISFGANRTINTAAGNITIGGAISGAGGITKNGSGTLTLSGAKSYAGGTTINGGTLSVGAGALPTNITINSGATLVLANHNMLSAGGNMTINSGTLNLSVYAQGSGPSVANFNDATITGGAGGFLRGVSTYNFTGNTTWGSGAMDLLTAPTLNVISGTTTLASAFNIGNGNNNITKSGNGTLVLSAANTYTSATILNAGTLAINNATAIGSGTLTIAGGTLDNTSAGAITLTNNNTQNWNGDFTFNGTRDLNIGTGAVTMNASRTVTVNAGNFTVGGAIGGATFGLTKNGSGTLILTGASTYNGTTTINAGNLTIGAADRIADTSNLNVAGGTFNLGGYNETLGSITGSGNITLGAGTLTTNSTSNTTFSGLISGTGGLTKNGSSTLALSGNNTYNGTTTISAGTIEIAAAGRLGAGNYTGNIVNNGTFIYSGTNNQTLGGIISGTGALTHNAYSTLTLTGSNTYNGATTVSAGTLVLNGNNSASAVTIASGATLKGSGSAGATTVSGTIAPGNSPGTLSVGALTLNSGGVYTWEMADATGVAGTGWDRIASSGLLTINSTSGSTFTIAITSTGAPTNWNYQTSSQSWDIITYGTISGFDATKFSINATAFGGTVGANNTSTWALIDTGSALRLTYTYAADPIWAGGTGNWTTGFSPAITNGANATFTGVGGTATNNIASATLSTLGTLTFNSTAGAYTLAANSGSSGYDAANAFTLAGNIINNSTATQTINIALTSNAMRVYDAAAGNITIGGSIAGTGGLTKNGSNLLILSGNNTYSGATTINAGTLTISGAGQLGGGNYTGNISNAGTFNYASSADQTLGGIISGNGALTKNGASNLTLTGVNTYTGATTITAGTITIGGAGQLGSGNYSGNISNSGRLVYASSANQTLGGTISGNGGLTKSGNGTLTLSHANTYNGSTTINAGTLSVTAANGLGATTEVTIDGGSLLVAASNAINDAADITMGNDGKLVLSGSVGEVVGQFSLTTNTTAIIDMGYTASWISFWKFTSQLSDATRLEIWNYTVGSDHVYIRDDTSGYVAASLPNIEFFSGLGVNSLGNGFFDAPEVHPHIVPEPETYATAALLLIGLGIYAYRRRQTVMT